MPQITFELSDNILEKDITKSLLVIHHILVDNLPTKLSACKSRILRHQHFLVGDGSPKNAFIHVAVEVLKGRTKQTLELCGQKILTMLQKDFALSNSELNLKLSVSIKELPDIYLRNNE
ncbi:MAG: hypothetical protein WBJ81_03160 [Rickettsiales bacterium]